MELLEEGLYKVNIRRAMDLDAPQSEEDILAIDLATMFAVFAGIAALIPPPCALVRSTNSASLLAGIAALIPPPCALVRSTNSASLPPNPHPIV